MYSLAIAAVGGGGKVDWWVGVLVGGSCWVAKTDVCHECLLKTLMV